MCNRQLSWDDSGSNFPVAVARNGLDLKSGPPLRMIHLNVGVRSRALVMRPEILNSGSSSLDPVSP